MRDENTPLNDLSPENEPEREVFPAPAEEGEVSPETPPRPTYTKKQRILALLGAIFVIIVTLMYTYSIATGDIFFR